jgi:hypothetical protein
MLGELLEFSIASDAIATAADFYRMLGFVEAEVGNIVTEPYMALGNRSVTVGLRETSASGPVPTFIRPNLKEHLRALRRQRIELAVAELADDQFHRAAFEDINGQLIAFVEARTCSPVATERLGVSPIGEFLELSVPTHSAAQSADFWRTLGLQASAQGSSPAPWLRLEGHGLTMGLYEGRRFAPGLSFICENLEARRAYLGAKGCEIVAGASFMASASAGVTLIGPSRERIYLFANEG